MWVMPRILKITSVVLLVVFLLFAAVFFYWSYQASITGDSVMATDLFWIGVLIAVIILGTFGGIFGFYYYVNKKESNLKENGIEGQAAILSAEQTGMYMNNLPQVKMLLEITIPGEVPYQIEHKQIMNYISIGGFSAGHVVPVLVDPNNPKNILLGEGSMIIPPEIEKNMPPEVKAKMDEIMKKYK